MKSEKYLFYFLILVHLFPLFLLPYFVTHDGPAHVYNSTLIRWMLVQSDSAATDFFMFNPQVLPNWISHLMLMLFGTMMSGALAEKLLIGTYIILFPLSFRKLVLSVNPEAQAATYLVFPFVQAFSILTGLYSFCIGLCLMFYLFVQWRRQDYLPVRKNWFFFSVCMLLVYFSHLFVFGLCLFTLGVLMSWELLTKYHLSLRKFFLHRKEWFDKVSTLVAVSIVPLILTLIFVYHQASKTDSEIPEFKTMLELFMDVRPIIALNYEFEKVYAQPLFYVYIILFLTSCFWKIKKWKSEKVPLTQPADAWLALSILMAVLYFFLPDDIFSGGIVAIRFCLMSFLFLLLWLSAYTPGKVMFIASSLSVLASLLLLYQRYPSQKYLSSEAADLATCSAQITENSTLLALNYSDNWMLDNVASYIASDKKIVLLDNYEANQVHFPLIWKPGRNPDEIAGNAGKSNRPCIDLQKFITSTGSAIDYILVMKRPAEINDSCTQSADRQLHSMYKEIYVTPSQNGILYEYRRGN